MYCSVCLENFLGGIVYKGKFYYRVSYEKSIDLVLVVSREYFNFFINFIDSCMDFVRCCL